MALLLDPQAWIAFATLTALELVLGIDNIIFISILVDKLPPTERERARRIGALKKRQDELAKQAAKYSKEGATPDGKFEQDVRAVAYDLDLQQQLLKSREREAAAINARYDEEKRKYVELTKGAPKK